MGELTPNGTAEPKSRDQSLRCERAQKIFQFPYSIDHEQDWQLYRVGAQSAESIIHIVLITDVKVLSISVQFCWVVQLIRSLAY